MYYILCSMQCLHLWRYLIKIPAMQVLHIFQLKKTRFKQFLEFCNCVCVETRSQNLRLKYYFLIIKKNTEIMIYITLNWSFGLTNVSIGVK